MVLITRNAFSDLGPAIERTVRRWNSEAPVFHASVRPVAWVEYRTGRRFPACEPPFERPGVFCGIGNPQSFRRTFAQMGIEPARWLDFGDHHRYRPAELRRLALDMQSGGADALATTEKDIINLCEGAAGLLAPLALYWLEVAMQVEEENEFEAALMSRLGR
jgi:tetraacyldisaccharide 4'-kinase